MGPNIVFIAHVAQDDEWNTEKHHFDFAHMGGPLPADDILAAVFHDEDDDQDEDDQEQGDIDEQFMPDRGLKLDFRRVGIGQIPQIGAALVVGFIAVADDAGPGREGNDVFQVDAVFRHRCA